MKNYKVTLSLKDENGREIITSSMGSDTIEALGRHQALGHLVIELARMIDGGYKKEEIEKMGISLPLKN